MDSPLLRKLNIVAWVFALLCLGITIYGILSLPETIPIHWNFAGQVDGYGSPLLLILLPFILVALNSGLMFLQTSDVSMNYPVRITPQNEAAQKRNAHLLLAVLRCSVGVLFTSIVCIAIMSATDPSMNLGYMLFPLIFLTIAPVFYFVYRSFTLK